MSFGQPDSLSSLGKTGKECTGASIVKALDQFMGAMTRMEETVMVPSRLKDMEAVLPTPPTRRLSQPPSRASSSVALSADAAGVITGNSASKTPPIRASSLDGAGGPSGDLFTYYRMLDSVRHELLSGEAARTAGVAAIMGGSETAGMMGGGVGTDSGMGSLGEATDDDLSSLDSEDLRESESHRLAVAFRRHLNGLYTVMNQLTLTANLVSDKYTNEVLNKPAP